VPTLVGKLTSASWHCGERSGVKNRQNKKSCRVAPSASKLDLYHRRRCLRMLAEQMAWSRPGLSLARAQCATVCVSEQLRDRCGTRRERVLMTVPGGVPIFLACRAFDRSVR
jgi:hypothetical protein